jgi:gliding motility-associated-like protein
MLSLKQPIEQRLSLIDNRPNPGKIMINFGTKSLALTLGIFMTTALSAQVMINEVCVANYSDWNLGGGNFEDWVEFYNPDGAAFDIGGYWLSDDPGNLMKWEIPAGTNVAANGREIIILSGLFEINPNAYGYPNTNFKVTQTAGEALVFSNPGGVIIEEYNFGTIGSLQMNQSYGRSSDGANDWVILTDPTPDASNGGASGDSYATKPVFDTQAGYYGAAITVSLSTPQADAVIYYSLNGSEVTDASTLYVGPINVNATTVIRAIAYHPDGNILPSFIETNTYFVGTDSHTIPIFSVAGGTLSDGQWNGDEFMSIEMFDANGNFVSEAQGDSNEHGNDSNAYAQRGFDYVTRDAMGYSDALVADVFPHTDRDHYERLIFKAAANDNYSFAGGAHLRDFYCHEISILADLKLDERAGLYCIVYINGEYWGVYDVREKADDIDYTDYYFDQPEGYVDYLKTWGGTWVEFGDDADWALIRDFMINEDMSDPANYDYATSLYNEKSLVDYFILNGYVVCTDWLNWNTAWWRGRHPDGSAKKWRYVLWDLDATFGHYINYTGVPDTSPQADPCDPDGLGDPGGQGHVPILNSLFENDEFNAYYINRYADLSNTYFSCDYMIWLVDSMTGVIDPEMERQADRWGGTYNGWLDNVQEVRDYILERCADEIISGLEDCYDVEAVTITVIIDGIGEVQISTVNIDELDSPWTGTYFAGIPLNMEALSEFGFFLGWEVVDGDLIIGDPTDPNLVFDVTGDLTIIAHFVNDIDPQLVTYNVVPDGAGDILVDAVPMGPYPNTTLTDGGMHFFQATENEWFVFDHWEFNNANFNPDVEDIEGTAFIASTDTIVAVFTEIPHWDITVDVMPAGAGQIYIDGTEIPSYSWTGTLEGDIDVNFLTIPTNQWNIFSHWQLNNNVIAPDELTADMIINLQNNDEIIAVYTVIPNFEITVVIDPPLSGVVTIGQDIVVNDTWTGVLQGETPIEFLATPVQFWNLDKWSATYHTSAPNQTDRLVYYSFTASDTVIAHFEPVDFTVFIPNSFTPNDDGKNDYFFVSGEAWDITDFILKIFNRWGDIVFQTNDPTVPWDGSYNGAEHYIQDQQYVYSMTVKSAHDLEEHDYSGHITVFR